MRCYFDNEVCGWNLRPRKAACLTRNLVDCFEDALNDVVGVSYRVLFLLGTAKEEEVTSYLVLVRSVTATLPAVEGLAIAVITRVNGECTVENIVSICPLDEDEE